MNIALPFDWSDAEEMPAERAASWTALPRAEQLLLWSLRHMLVCWPTCGSVPSALHDAYGDDALGLEHLLRCFLTAIGAWSARSLAVGDPTCALLLADEGILLYVLRTARADPSAARTALAELCAEPRAGALLPLAASLAEVAGLAGSASRAGREAV